MGKWIERASDRCVVQLVVRPDQAACIPFNEVYALVRGNGQSLAELAQDQTDYKAEIVKYEASPGTALVRHVRRS